MCINMFKYVNYCKHRLICAHAYHIVFLLLPLIYQRQPFFSGTRQNLIARLILENWTKTNTTDSTQGLDCGISTNKKQQQQQQQQQQAPAQEQMVAQPQIQQKERKYYNTKTQTLRRCVQGGEWHRNVNIVSQAEAWQGFRPSLMLRGNCIDQADLGESAARGSSVTPSGRRS
jgi:hypothetical protein